ncbi:MAG: hypothetical protein PHF92_07650 [Bacteroidales bacterium]|nr:hypothetical protein [Bacteroidales bacterium]
MKTKSIVFLVMCLFMVACQHKDNAVEQDIKFLSVKDVNAKPFTPEEKTILDEASNRISDCMIFDEKEGTISLENNATAEDLNMDQQIFDFYKYYFDYINNLSKEKRLEIMKLIKTYNPDMHCVNGEE